MADVIGDNSYLPTHFADMAMGLIPRDMAAFPVGSFAPPAQIKTLSRPEISDRIKERKAAKSSLRDLRHRGMPDGSMIPSLNQNDPNRRGYWGYCWYYASVHALLLLRAKMNEPFVQLSAFGGAFTNKNGRNDGGWGALSVDDLTNKGATLKADWPDFDTRMRSPDDICWQNAKKYRFTDGFVELNDPVYDRDLTIDQVDTLLVQNVPVVVDLNWMGHCMVMYDIDEVNGKIRRCCWNTWGDQAMDGQVNGDLWLEGSRAVPDNAVAPTVATAA